MLIDSHCHLEIADFGDQREQVIQRARDAGLGALICIGSGKSLDEVHNAISLAETHADIWAAIGIHPHEAARVPEGALQEIERLAQHPRVVAIGETGLDYYYDHSPRAEQQQLLREFIAIAKRVKKPLSFHIRDAAAPRSGLAHGDALAIADETHAGEVGGCIHCFTGTRAEAEKWIALGFHISFSGAVTFKSAAQIREAAAWMPIERMLVETDCPYLAPVPLRGKRNEPAYLVHTARLLAEVRGISFETLCDATADNTRRLFLTTP
jgi:TatD DNase family protein